jgi:hypothetical protein
MISSPTAAAAVSAASALADIPKVVVTLDGGVVQSILATDGTPVRAMVIDYDTEGADESDLTPVPQGEGRTVLAFVRERAVDMISAPEMAALFATAGDEDEADDGCPVGDPSCTSRSDECHDASEASTRSRR